MLYFVNLTLDVPGTSRADATKRLLKRLGDLPPGWELQINDIKEAEMQPPEVYGELHLRLPFVSPAINRS